MLQIMANNLNAIFATHSSECKCTGCDDEGHKYALAISIACLHISNDNKGKQFLKTSGRDVIQKIVLSLPLIKCQTGEKIKMCVAFLMSRLHKHTICLLKNDF